jgi:hypothetical protein
LVCIGSYPNTVWHISFGDISGVRACRPLRASAKSQRFEWAAAASNELRV